jgi:glycosyltransferase involved in cell wall biosynthesis
MLELTDRAIANELPPCDVFIGLSGMAVRSAKVARQKYGAKVFIDRGSRHVRSQNKLTSADGGVGLTEFYIQRELDSYAAADYIALPSSHAMKSFLEEGFAEKQLFVNSYGVDFTLFEPTPAPALPLKLLFVGGWSYQKGADILSAALSRLPNCTLTHAGTRVDVKYPSGQQFRALGHVPAHMLPAIFADHHILVLPSRQDGFGMVLLEAMASGLGVVASHITGGPDIRSVIERKVFVNLVRPGSVDDLVRGIRELECTLPRQGSDRAILSNTEKDYFSWRSYAQRYVEFMRSSIQDT